MSARDKSGPTPGPYQLERAENEQIEIVLPEGGMTLATVLLSDRTGCGSDDDQTDDEFNAEMAANARLFAASWDFAAACTPERLDALAEIIVRLGAEDSGEGVVESVRGMMQYAYLVDLLTALRAAMGRVEGQQVTP